MNLTTELNLEGRIYELAGDESYTLSEFATMISRAAKKPMKYQDMPEIQFKDVQSGLPEPVASLLANCDAAAATCALFDDGHALSGLIGRPTTPASATVLSTVETLL